MKIIPPFIARLSPNGLLVDRTPQAVFVRKHNLQINLEAVEAETKIVSEINLLSLTL